MVNENKLMIEYVCTGNNGRSPMAEAIALDYVHSRGLENRIEISSSGSGLHEATKLRGEKWKKQYLGVVELALKNGIYQESWRQDNARRVMELGMNVEDRVLDACVYYAVNVEAHLRNEALWEKGLVAAGKYHKPTKAEYSGVILPMAESNTKQVCTIYDGSSFTPRVESLNWYVGVEGDVPNPFCQLLPVYQQSRDHLMRVVPMSIDKAVEEWL